MKARQLLPIIAIWWIAIASCGMITGIAITNNLKDKRKPVKTHDYESFLLDIFISGIKLFPLLYKIKEIELILKYVFRRACND